MKITFLLSAIVLMAISIPNGMLAQPTINSEIAPLGKLRVAMNGGNPALLKWSPDGKIIGGVGLEVGSFIADKIGVPLEMVPYKNSATFTQSYGKGEWDIGIGPPIQLAAEKADFGPVLLLLDHVYVAAPGQEFTDATQVDRLGVKIGCGLKSAQDVFLSQTLKFAELVRMPGGRASAVKTLHSGEAHLWAANATQAHAIVKNLPGANVIPGAFNQARSSVALPKGRSSVAQEKLVEIVNEAKRTGIVQKAIEQAGLRGVRVAP